jgi:hypothetical protein
MTSLALLTLWVYGERKDLIHFFPDDTPAKFPCELKFSEEAASILNILELSGLG